jgi:site-specific DNA recombinase
LQTVFFIRLTPLYYTKINKREESLQREQVRIQKNIDRLVTAYQEGLVTLEQLRHRMPELRRQEKAVQSELLSLAEATADQSRYMRLVETLAQFRERLRARADSLEVGQRQKILRLLVKEILVGYEIITIRHSIPPPHSGPGSDGSPGPASGPPIPLSSAGYLLCTGSQRSALRRTFIHRTYQSVFHHSGSQKCAD